MHPRMAILRTSMLRATVRQPRTSSHLSIPLRSIAQAPNQWTGQGDFGGPGDLEPPPRAPRAPMGARDVTKRSWRTIATALVGVAGLAYIVGGGPKKSTVEKQLEPVVRDGEKGLKKLEEAASNAVNELSGKKPGGMGGFRSE